jgi:hypothetical protein
VDIEYDSRSAVLRATASGQIELRQRDLGRARASDEERASSSANSLGVAPGEVELAAEAGMLRAYRARLVKKRFLGLARECEEGVAVVDEQGIVRLVLEGGFARAFPAGQASQALPELLDSRTRYRDAGAELPQLFLGVGGRIVNLSGLAEAAQVLSLAAAELAGAAEEQTVLAIVAPRGA